MSMLKCAYHSTQHFNGGLLESAKLRGRFMAEWVDQWLRLVFLSVRSKHHVFAISQAQRGAPCIKVSLTFPTFHFPLVPLSS